MEEIIQIFEEDDVETGGAMLMHYFCDYIKDDPGHFLQPHLGHLIN
jgi:hypothetical protein